LLEARLERDGETLGCVSWLRHGSDLTVFNGTSPGVHALNKAVPVNLSDRQAALDYLRFFCAIVHGNEGAFRVIETPGQLRLLPDLPEGVAGRVRAYARPAGDWHDQRAPEREDETDGNSYVEALVLYSNALFLSWFKVLGSGMIEMVNDEPVVLDLPVEIERFDGVLRRLEPIQSGDSPSFSDDKPTSDNPKDAKDDTAPARNSATPGVADSAPPPEPASTEKTDLPAPPRSAKRGGWLIALVLLAALGAAAGYWALTGMPRP